VDALISYSPAPDADAALTLPAAEVGTHGECYTCSISSDSSTDPNRDRNEPRTRLTRADLTDAEWKALRVTALQRNETVQRLVSELLRHAAARWSP